MNDSSVAPPPTHDAQEPSSPSAAAATGTAGAGSRALALLVTAAGLVALWLLTVSEDDRAAMWRTWSLPGFAVNLVVTLLAAGALYVGMGSGDRVRRLFRVAAGAMMLALFLIVAELPVVLLGTNYEDLFHTGPPGEFLHTANAVNVTDPVLLHVHRPGSGFTGQVVGNLVELGIPHPTRYDVDVRYDGNGFRNDVTPTQADVVAIGDSFVEAALIRADRTAAARVASSLGGTYANLGQIDYGLRQELAVLERFGLPLKPKLVLWFFFEGNDLRDVEGYERAAAAYGREGFGRPLRYRLFTRNVLTALANLTTAPRQTASKAARTRSGMFVTSDGTAERVYFGQTNGPWSEHEWQVLTETLSAADRLCRQQGARLLVIYIPRKFRVYREHMTFEPGTLAAEWSVNDLPKALSGWCADAGVDLLDVTPRLSDVVARGEHTYFPDDVHWNEAGHKVAAEAILAFLRDGGWSDNEP